jgi:hypothetical protein
LTTLKKAMAVKQARSESRSGTLRSHTNAITVSVRMILISCFVLTLDSIFLSSSTTLSKNTTKQEQLHTLPTMREEQHPDGDLHSMMWSMQQIDADNVTEVEVCQRVLDQFDSYAPFFTVILWHSITI